MESLTRPRPIILPMLLLAALLLGACAGKGEVEIAAAPEAEREAHFEQQDIFEPFNRYMFEVNIFLDTFFLKPMATWYAGLTPPVFRVGAGNFFDNLKSPVVLANNLLQGEYDAAEITTARFAINSSVGMLGFLDLATRWGYPSQKTDFGQTMGNWDVPHGPYLMLPFFGPSTMRDAGGIFVDTFFDPLTYNLVSPRGILYGLSGWRIVNARAEYLGIWEDLYTTSVDPYASVRSLYFQSRVHADGGDGELDIDALPDLDDYDFSQ